MNCRNCGAAMELFERRRYYFCTFCGTFSFIETPAVEGVRVLERPAAARSCPLCTIPLVKALLDDVYSVEHCEQCRGLLLARATFAEAIPLRRAREPGPPAAPVPLDARELKRVIDCPSCRARMDVHPYLRARQCRHRHLRALRSHLARLRGAAADHRRGGPRQRMEGHQALIARAAAAATRSQAALRVFSDLRSGRRLLPRARPRGISGIADTNTTAATGHRS